MPGKGERINLMFKNRAFSILEVFVATSMVALVIIGLANIFLAGKRLILHVREKAAAAQLSYFFLEPLYFSVKQSDWNQNIKDYISSNILSKGNKVGSSIVLPSGGTFTPFYSVSDPLGFGSTSFSLRKVALSIRWQEAQ